MGKNDKIVVDEFPKKQVFIIGDGVTEELTAKIKKAIESKDIEVVLVPSIDEGRRLYPDKIKDTIPVMIPDEKNNYKSIIIAGHEHLNINREITHNGITHMVAPEKFITKLEAPKESPVVEYAVDFDDEKKYGVFKNNKPVKNRSGYRESPKNSESMRRKKRHSQKKARKNNRKK